MTIQLKQQIPDFDIVHYSATSDDYGCAFREFLFKVVYFKLFKLSTLGPVSIDEIQQYILFSDVLV